MNRNRQTNYRVEELKCPKCGKIHQMKKYSVINAVEKPGMKEDILKNRIFYFHCENCGMEAPLTYETTYVDSRRKLMIYLPGQEECLPEIQEKEKAMSFRIVDNINDLKEKIMIAENHLDDRVIELVKIQYLRQLERELKNDTLMNILFDYYKEEMSFLAFFEKKGIGRIPLQMDLYKKTEEEYKKQIRLHSKPSFMKVDMEWAGRVFFNPM
ncbi:MAG: CpXC domain-containing protein [Eubacteriales bacterium]|nr:CpXC domain-containing protein [Eubacteriales bacterium]